MLPLWNRLAAARRAHGLSDASVAASILCRGQDASAAARDELILPLAWLVYRYAPERSGFAAVHVPLALLQQRDGLRSMDALLEDLRCLGGDVTELTALLAASPEVLSTEIDEALERPRFREREAAIERVVAGAPVQDDAPVVEAARVLYRSQKLQSCRDFVSTHVEDAGIAPDQRARLALIASLAVGEDPTAALAWTEKSCSVHRSGPGEFYRATYLLQLGRNGEAAEAARKAIGWPGTDVADAYRVLGVALDRAGQAEEAERAFTRTLVDELAGPLPLPSESPGMLALMLRFGSRVHRGALGLALEDADLFTRVSEPGDWGRVYRAEVFCAQGRYDDAGLEVRKLVDAEHPAGLLAMANLELVRGRPGAAREAIDGWMRGRPESWLGHLIRARSLAASGDAEAAVEDILFALKPEIWAQATTHHRRSHPFANRDDAERFLRALQRRVLEDRWRGRPCGETVAAAREVAVQGDFAGALRLLLAALDSDRAAARESIVSVLSIIGREDAELEELRRDASNRL